MHLRVLLFLQLALAGWPASVASQSVAPPRHTESALGVHADRPLVIYTRDHTSPCFADYVPTAAEVERSLTVTLARNEYEPLQIGVYVPSGAAGLTNVTLSVRVDLPHEIGSVYYEAKARPRIFDRGQPFEGRRGALPLYVIPGAAIPSIEPGNSAAFWITLGSDRGVEPGAYAATLTIAADGVTPTTRSAAIEVHPFALPRPRIAFGCYYRVDRIPVYFGRKYKELYARDQARHGHNCAQIISFFSAFGLPEYPKTGRVPRPEWLETWRDLIDPEADASGVLDPVQFLEAQMEIFADAGLTHPDIPTFGVQDNPRGGAKQFTAETLRALSVERGWPEILLYMRDEPPPWIGPGFDSGWVDDITQYKRIRECRSITAMGGASVVAWGHIHDVWTVLGGFPTPEMRREAARQGAKVWTYLHDLRITNPVANRFYAGLYTWGLDLAGNVPYAYQHGEEGQPHPVFLPGKRRPSREQVMGFILAGPDGPIPGVGWEGRREGIDDYRYLQLLEARVAAASAGDPVKAAAESWLGALRQRIEDIAIRGVFLDFVTLWDLDWLNPVPDLDPRHYRSIRDTAARFIARLEPAAGEDNPPSRPREFPPGGLEGAEFEGESLAACLAVLRGGTTESRRAAACAIALRTRRELASFPADGLVALVPLLDDPELRVPALRALRAMGPAARSEIPAIRSRLRHPDPFIRMHAVLTLDAMGPEAIDGLISSLEDPFPGVILLAAECIARKGAAARAALPVLERVQRLPNPRVRNAAISAAGEIRASMRAAAPSDRR